MDSESKLGEIRADVTLDAYGLLCPLPIIKTAQRIKSLVPGTILEVIATDSGIAPDLHNWCKAQGHQYLGCRQEIRVYHAYLVVGTKAGKSKKEKRDET